MLQRPLLVLLLTATALFAQNATPGTGNPAPVPPTATRPIFQAMLPGGTYEVATASMVSVSTHEYLVDGVARVTEVNIDTAGSLVVRFYFLEPNPPNTPHGVGAAVLDKAQKLLTEVEERSGQDAWKKVLKTYPTTTHARTVEYRLDKKEQLSRIFNAADEAFRTQRSKSVSVE